MFSIQTRLGLQQGNPAAFKEVFRLLYPRMREYCKLFLNDESTVEDMIQESFIAIWEKRDTIKPHKPIESFAFVILRNRCLNQLKKLKLENNHQLELDNPDINPLQFLYQLDFMETEEAGLEELLMQALRREIENLPQKRKEAFVKCKIEARKQSDVALEMGISLKMVEKHVAKAKEQIRKTLSREYPMLLALIVLLLD